LLEDTDDTETTDLHGTAEPQPNQSPWRFLCVLGVLAVKERFRIHRQDAKSAKNFAKQNYFQENKDSRLSSTGLFIGENP